MLKLVIQNFISFKKSTLLSLPEGANCLKVIEKKFSYKNPDYIEAAKWGRSTYGMEEYVYSYYILGDDFKLNRGTEKRLIETLTKFNIEYEIMDFTVASPPTKIFSKAKYELREEQHECKNSFTNHARKNPLKQMIWLANTSFGKTFTGIYLANELEQVTLVLVHTKFAQTQWINALKNDFGVNPDNIGGAGGSFKKPKVGKINIALYHSMSKREINIFFRDKIGFVIVDEVQLASINQFKDAITAFRPRYLLGMTAGSEDSFGVTQLYRKDGKEFMIKDLIGDVGFRSRNEESNSKIFAEIFSTVTNYYPDDVEHPSQILTCMSRIKERNILIAKRAIIAHRSGRIVIIFVERKEQAAVLAKFLSKYRVGLLIGNVPPAEIAELDISDKAKEYLLNNKPDQALDDITEKCLKKEIDFIIATQKGEVGLSIETLGHGIVTTPVGNNIERLNQLKGRLERKHKDQRLEDYGEKETPYLEIIVDNYASSINSWTALKSKFKKYVIKNPYKTKEVKNG